MPSRTAELPQHQQQPYLLLVDDEEAFLDMLCFRLDTMGIPTLRASRGEDALPLLEQQNIELVLLDLNMPGISGMDLLQIIKKQRPDIEVLLLTGESALGTVAQGMRRGAGDYLLKPVDMPSLLESIAKARLRVRVYKERQRAAESGRLVALGSLAHGVGHEINNPLQVVVQGAEWLCELIEDSKNGLPLDLDEVEATALKILGQARACARITGQLLDMASRTRNRTAEIRLEDLLRKVADRNTARAQSIQANITLDLPETLPPLAYSQAELEPVIAQLVDNALDAIEAAPNAPEAGHNVTISARRAENRIRVEVRDTGEGIAPENAQRIFDPFFSTRPVGTGSGLGLTTCHNILTVLRGVLRHYPNAPQGTTMVVELPIVSNAEKESTCKK